MAGRRHTWKEREADGQMRFYRGTFFGGRWDLRTQLKGEEYWDKLDPPSHADLVGLHEVVYAKYQRKRLPYEALKLIEDMMEEALEEEGAAATSGELGEGQEQEQEQEQEEE